MADLRAFLIILLLSSITTALPTAPACAKHYPLARNSIPLYGTLPSALGNFLCDITIGNQTVSASLDTGSSNTLFMQQETQCLDPTTFQPQSGDDCGYPGPRVVPSTSFELMKTHANISHGSSQTLTSTDGDDDLAFGGIKILKQEISLATTILGTFLDQTSGGVGLAYPYLTSTYPGNNVSFDVSCSDTKGENNTGCTEQHYSPIMTTIFADKLAPPIFAFAIGRSTPGAGVMPIGGLPDLKDPRINVTGMSTKVAVPIEKYGKNQHLLFYTITIEGLQYPSAAAGAGDGQGVVDSGTIQIIAGTEQAETINALFNPPAQYNKSSGLYEIACNATAPEFGMEIGGKVFGINPEDMVLYGPESAATGICASAIVGGTAVAGEPRLLGSVFLRNVLAVFDVGKSQMTFASCMYYQE